MPGRYEMFRILGFALNVAARVGPRSPAAPILFEWAEHYAAQLGIPPEALEPEDDEARPRHHRRSAWMTPRMLARFRDTLERQHRRLRTVRSSVAARNLDRLGEDFGLDAVEREILEIGYLYKVNQASESLIDSLRREAQHDLIDTFAVLLARPRIAVTRALRRSGRLVRSGLLVPDHENGHNAADLPDGLIEAVQFPARDSADLRRRLTGKPLATSLRWEDFDHLGAERAFVADLLAGAAASSCRGINVLLYGPPGTGKTEFCKLVARQIGAELFAVAEQDGDGAEPGRGERLARLRLSQALLAHRPHSLLLFDEMEDLLGSTASLFGLFGIRERHGSKVFLNRMLEENTVPTLWTCNDIRAFDPALLRRMTAAVEMRTPPAPVRERVWRRTLARHRVRLPAEDVRALARSLDAPPALAANAVKAARLAGGGTERIRLAVRSVAKAMAGGRELPPVPAAEAAYDPRLANADVDLEAIAERLAGRGAQPLSLCLFGPPGTGKTAYVRHLAERMGLEAVQKRASDLLSMWVGESEKNIAAAFAEARAAGTFLVFDEADSLLQDRGGASRSWEVTQVNEMLTWMEVHPLPFACTTNLMERLDAASLRRFTFKVRFGFMTPSQVRAAFAAFFALEPPAGIERLDMLTPGDFALVRRKAAALGRERDAAALVDLLRAERDAKPGAPKAIGFGTR